MTCYLTPFRMVLGLSEDVFWLRAQISPSAPPCVLEGGGGGERKKTTIGDLAELQHTDSAHVPAEPQTSTRQLNKWPRREREGCRGTSGEERGGREPEDSWWWKDRLMKEGERFKERARHSWVRADKRGRGEGAPCEERASSFHWRFGWNVLISGG